MTHIIFIILQFILKIKRKLTLTSEKDIFLRLPLVNIEDILVVRATNKVVNNFSYFLIVNLSFHSIFLLFVDNFIIFFFLISLFTNSIKLCIYSTIQMCNIKIILSK